MNWTLAIDSGVLPACAYFNAEGRLMSVQMTLRPGGAGISTVVVEAASYRGADDLAVVGNLFKMVAGGYFAAGHAAAFEGAEVIELTPREWKGQEPKPSNHVRLWAALTPAERKILGGPATESAIEAACHRGAGARWSGKADWYPRSLKQLTDRLDAAAMGCTYLGRMAKAGA